MLNSFEEFIAAAVDGVSVQHPAENALSGLGSRNVHVRDNLPLDTSISRSIVGSNRLYSAPSLLRIV